MRLAFIIPFLVLFFSSYSGKAQKRTIAIDYRIPEGKRIVWTALGYDFFCYLDLDELKTFAKKRDKKNKPNQQNILIKSVAQLETDYNATDSATYFNTHNVLTQCILDMIKANKVEIIFKDSMSHVAKVDVRVEKTRLKRFGPWDRKMLEATANGKFILHLTLKVNNSKRIKIEREKRRKQLIKEGRV